MATASTRIPKPKDWQEFERQIEVLAQCILGDPSAKGNGRQGQRQNGVDVFGWRPEKVAVGFQCKEHFETPVTEKELRAEVEKAKRFRPKLKEFILVTTAGRDAAIQEVARLLTEQRNDFSVDVWSWEDIEQHVAKHPAAMKAFDPTYSPLISEEIREMSELILAQLQLQGVRQAEATGSPEVAHDDDESTKLHGQITLIQSMIDDGEVLAAIPLLNRLLAKDMEKATPGETYRFRIAQANVAIKRERFDEAGHYLIDAAQVHPSHKNATSNLAIGFLLTGDSKSAEKAATDVLKVEPDNQKMADTFAQARAQQDVEDPFEGIPSALLNSSVIWGLRSSLSRMKGDTNWKQIARDGISAHPDDKFLKRFAAEAVIDDCIVAAPFFTHGEPGGDITRRDVDAAATELRDQILALRSIGGDVSSSLAHNAALGCRLVDRFDEALDILSASIIEHPDELDMVEQVAMHHVHHGDAAEAIRLLEGVSRSQGGNCTLAAAYIEYDRFDDAKVLLDSVEYPSNGNLNPFQFLGVHFEWFRRQKLPKDAKTFFSTLSQQYPDDVMVLLFVAKTARLLGDEEGGAKAIEGALNQLDAQSPFGIVYEVASEAFRGQLYEIVVQLLKDRVEVDHENIPLSLCISAAMNGKLHNTAIELLDRFPDDVAEDRWYRRVRLSLENRIGSERTLPLLNSFLKDFPDDAEMRTARIGLWLTLGNVGKIQQDIEETNIDALSGTPFCLMQYYRIASAYSDGSKSVPRAYQLLLQNWDNVDCHTGYHGLFLTNEKMEGVDLAPANIKTECVFRVRSDKDGERWYRIEDTKPAVFGDEWLAPNEELAKTFFGKSANATVQISGPYGEIEWTILEVKSVYLDTFQRSIQRFKHRFPNSGAMFQLSVDTAAEDPFVELKQMVRRMSERDTELLNLYRDNPVPIAWLAGVLGKDEIECSVGLPAEMGIPFRVCQGSMEEREEAFSIIKNNARRGVIVDVVSAVMIKRLGVLQAVEAVCGPVQTTSTTIERLAERYHELEGMLGRSMGSFGYRNGQYVLTDYSDEQQSNALNLRSDELKWARKHLKIVPSLPSTELSPDAKKMADLVGTRAIAPALAANGSGLPLLADDYGIRLWSTAALNVEGLWLQPVLMKARDDGVLSENDYSEAVLAMADGGFTYVSLDNRTLLYGLRKSGFNVDQVSKPLRILLGKPADLNRNLLIAIGVMIALNEEECPPITIYRFASEIARAAVYPRWSQAQDILDAIATAPIPHLREHLEGWLYWNSLGSKS